MPTVGQNQDHESERDGEPVRRSRWRVVREICWQRDRFALLTYPREVTVKINSRDALTAGLRSHYFMPLVPQPFDRLVRN